MHVGGAGSKPWGVGIENMQRGLVQGIRTGSWYLERFSGLAYIRVYDPFILISLIHFSLFSLPLSKTLSLSLCKTRPEGLLPRRGSGSWPAKGDGATGRNPETYIFFYFFVLSGPKPYPLSNFLLKIHRRVF